MLAVKYDAFRFDARSSMLRIRNTNTGDSPLDAMLGDTKNVSGAKTVPESVDLAGILDRRETPNTYWHILCALKKKKNEIDIEFSISHRHDSSRAARCIDRPNFSAGAQSRLPA
ncbi:hypothetical protein [Ralstonia sp. A12]|uniref:hypothetical protein n=1 Tax=Ralstonia sp. A12 TaxID=1217052 RepID=UPI0018DD7D70|nr:hypothetical protein [Ralstonia sp. A12]